VLVRGISLHSQRFVDGTHLSTSACTRCSRCCSVLPARSPCPISRCWIFSQEGQQARRSPVL
jgi:hypothetical protein